MTTLGKTCAFRSSPLNRTVWLCLRFAFPLAFIVISFPPAARAAGLERYEYSLPRMGTLFRIELYAPSQNAALLAATRAFDRIEQLEAIFSDYRSDSELNRLSRQGAAGPQLVSRNLFEILERAQQISERTGGAFDITVGPEVALWREARRTRRLPTATQLAQARAAVGYQNLVLDREKRTVLLKRPDMKLDLGGIAKGYAADQALEVLKSQGIASALIDAGGDLTLGAPPPGKAGWKVSIASPDAGRLEPPCTLVLQGVAIATSGNSRQFVEINGRRYSHIVNPSNGEGLTGAASTTVIAPDGSTADALATALSVLPLARGLQVVESIKGASAYLVRRETGQWQRRASRGFPQQRCSQLARRGR